VAINPPPAPSGSGKQSITQTLRSKALGLPVWVWGLILVALVALYLWRKKSQSSTAASTATTGTTTYGSTALGTTDPTNAAYLAGMQAATTTPATAATPAGATAPAGTTGESPAGAGYNPVGSFGAQVSDSAGNVYTWLSGLGALTYAQQGGQLYYQPTPGQFTPVSFASFEGASQPSLPGGTAVFALSTPAGGGGKASGGVVPVRAQMASAPRQPGGVASGGGLVSGLGTSMQSVPVHPSSP